jgi:2Fe-2S ferredoxin
LALQTHAPSFVAAGKHGASGLLEIKGLSRYVRQVSPGAMPLSVKAMPCPGGNAFGAAATAKPRARRLEPAEKMVKITFVQEDGTRQEVDAEPGLTVMEAAKTEDVPGIEAECGGASACATCHVYVEPEWREAVGPPSEMEEDMLDFAFDVREESRLSCQVRISEKLDGLVVKVPSKQF